MQFEDMKDYASKNRVPITKDDTISFVCDTINKFNAKQVLEIGTAIGFGSINMATNTNLEHIDTLEINNSRYNEAIKNISNYGLDDKISVHLVDAKLYLETCDKKYDFVYLDGPKGQYINYLPKIVSLLNPHGIIIADNLYFHGMVTGEIPVSRGCRAMINGLKKYIEEVTTNPMFSTEILNIGDGVGISILK